MFLAQYIIFLLIGGFGVWFGITTESAFPVELRWFFVLAGITLIVISVSKIVDRFNEEHYC